MNQQDADCSLLRQEVEFLPALGGAVAGTSGSEMNSDADGSEDEGDGPSMDTAQEESEQFSAAAAFDAAIAALSTEKTEKIKQLKALRTLCFKSLAESGNRTMTGSKQWQALKEACAKTDHKACGSPICVVGVKPLTAFAKDKEASDGKRNECSDCRSPAMCKKLKAFRADQKTAHAKTLADRPAVKYAFSTEDRFAAYLEATFPQNVEVMPEFRRFDVAWNDEEDGDEEARIRVQLKASESNGCQVNFNKCFGYGSGEAFDANAKNTGVMVLGWYDPEIGTYRVWVLAGTDVPSDCMAANTKTLRLCPWSINIEPITDINELPVAIRRASKGLRSTYNALFLDVEQAEHRSEIALMLALKQTGHDVAFPKGNQGVVDCFLDGTPTQTKTHNIDCGFAKMAHSVNGKTMQPYHAGDAIDQVAVGCIVRSGETYWLMHAIIPKTKLIQEAIFSSGEKLGSSSLSLPLGDNFGPWLVGRSIHGQGRPDWRVSPIFGWRPPVKLTITDELPLSYLENAAQPAARPELAPTEAKLEYLKARLERALAEKAAAEAKKAAREAKAASAAGPSSVTNNNNITINNHVHVHGAGKKRLCDGDLKNFFLKG